MNERGRNESDISRYTDVEYSPEGYKTVYRWGDFLEIAGGHVYNAMDTIDLVSTGGEYEGFNPRYAYTCEFVGCSTLVDGIALFRPVSRDGEDLTQIAFLRSDIDDDTGAYTECFEAGSFDIAAASDIQCSDLGIDLLDYFRGRSFEGLSGVKRGLNGREAVGAVEVATGCDLDLFEDFWLGSPGETDVHVGPYVKRDLIALSYIVNDFSQMYGTTARDIRKLLARVNNFHPDRLAAASASISLSLMRTRRPATSTRRQCAPSPTTDATRSRITAPTCISTAPWSSRGRRAPRRRRTSPAMWPRRPGRQPRRARSAMPTALTTSSTRREA